MPQKTVSRKIESELFRFKKADYLLNGDKNWSPLRKHVYAIEQYCRQYFGDRLPARHDISKRLANALADNYSSLSYHRSKESLQRKRKNLFKSQLQSFGVQFPAPDESLPSPPWEKTLPPILATAPTNAKEETEQLELVMRESLRSQRECNSCVMSTHNMFPSGYHAALTC